MPPLRSLCVIVLAATALVLEMTSFATPALLTTTRSQTQPIPSLSVPRLTVALSAESSSLSSPDTTSSEQPTVTTPDVAARLKQELLTLGVSTNRGFKATRSEREQAIKIIDELARYNPTSEPAWPYYDDTQKAASTSTTNPSVAGKWTLVYTDAPDITSLDSTPTAKLGRIGQECIPPYVKNVIEWKRPDWASSLPFSGDDNSRVLQVSTKGTASPSSPLTLDLKLAGIELLTDNNINDDDDGGTATTDNDNNNNFPTDPRKFIDSITKKGLPAGLLFLNPINLEGPITAPFGKATILFLDEQVRVLRTYQNYVAVNIRCTEQDEWF